MWSAYGLWELSRIWREERLREAERMRRIRECEAARRRALWDALRRRGFPFGNGARGHPEAREASPEGTHDETPNISSRSSGV